MNNQHSYILTIEWTGNRGTGTSNYTAYDRSHSIHIDGKRDIAASSDPAFRGDKAKHNPEELFLASLSSCHMLWYLHLCAEAGVVVVDYFDQATGIMGQTTDGLVRFKKVALNPVVTVTEEAMIDKANQLHKRANELCFIANSVNFEVSHNPMCKIG